MCCFLCQDGVYHTLQSAVDFFREAVGIPLEKKYNSVLFGGTVGRSHPRCDATRAADPLSLLLISQV